jgi:hypothetical protein
MAEINERALDAAFDILWPASDWSGGDEGLCREITRAAILAYESALPAPASVCAGEPVGYVSNCGIGQLEREGWVAISRTPVKTTDTALYAAPPASTGVEAKLAKAKEALKPFAASKLPSNRRADEVRDRDETGLRGLYTPLRLAVARARQALSELES